MLHINPTPLATLRVFGSLLHRPVGSRKQKHANVFLWVGSCPKELPRCRRANAGVLSTNPIIPLFAQKRPSNKILAPTRCGNGHELTPHNL